MLFWVVAIAAFALSVEGTKVLVWPSTLQPVHPFTIRFLVDELAKRKHEVTWVEHGPRKSSVELPKEVKKVYWEVSFGDRFLEDLFVHRNHSLHTNIWTATEDDENAQTTAWLASVRLCDSLLSRPAYKKSFDALVKEDFDTLIVDDLYNPCGLLLAGLKGAVYIYWSLTSLRTESAWANQSPSPPSYLPVAGTRLTDDLTFAERSYNLAAYLRALYLHQHIVHNRMDAVFQKHYPGVASAFDLERNASINFVNTPPIFDFARPYMPRVNFVGGLHCRKAQPLTGELAKFVDAATEEEGFILFTTGFTAQWKLAPKSVKDTFLTVFRERGKTRFVWQLDGPKPADLPRNVFVAEWLPQQDLLGHKKCKAHISHGGLNSLIESMWHGVPVLAFPLTVQGHDNALRITARDAGVLLTKKQLSVPALRSALDKVLEKKVKEEVLIFQDMVTDVPYTELTHAAFWVEFIGRHHEVPHARSGADVLNVFQYFLVDVILFLVSVVTLFFCILFYTVRAFFRLLAFFFRLLTGRQSTTKKTKKE